MNIGVVCKPNLPNIDEIDKVLLANILEAKIVRFYMTKNFYIKSRID